MFPSLAKADVAALSSLFCIANSLLSQPDRSSILHYVYFFTISMVIQIVPRVNWMNVLIVLIPLSISMLVGTGIFWLLTTVYLRRKLYLLPNQRGFEERREFLGKPFLFPTRLSHTRMFPEKYNYWYSYFLVGVPVGLGGSVGTVLSIDTNRPEPDGSKPKRRSNWCWFEIDQEHYLDPGNSPDGLEGKLHSWLKSRVCHSAMRASRTEHLFVIQGEDPQQWPYAYLISVPVFLGCTRNAVSWWFLYSPTRELNAMVFEANNSFGERHSSFVRLEQIGADIRHDNHILEAMTVPATTSEGSRISLQFLDSKPQFKSYKAQWSKDFFLSPFEKVEGSLSASCGDPCVPKEGKNGDIKLNVTLHAPDGRAKIISRVYPCGDPVDPLSTTSWGLMKFLVGWSYIGALSRPRIIYEALRIRFRGNMSYLKKPQVNRHNIPRDETQLERLVG